MNKPLPQPTDHVRGTSEVSGLTLMDFWRWAFSDLCDDDMKGIYAEWLVHKLLGVPSARRVSWANSDVITPGGVRIEVKSTAYWQSWKFVNECGKFEYKEKYSPQPPSKIRFAGLKARDATDAGATGPQDYKSDLYVFAFQKEQSIERWDALDLSQWEFFLLSAEELRRHGAKSISLAMLRNEYDTLSASELAKRGRAAVAEVEACKAHP